MDAQGKSADQISINSTLSSRKPRKDAIVSKSSGNLCEQQGRIGGISTPKLMEIEKWKQANPEQRVEWLVKLIFFYLHLQICW